MSAIVAEGEKGSRATERTKEAGEYCAGLLTCCYFSVSGVLVERRAFLSFFLVNPNV